jgi:hypothetical protein
MRLDIGPRVSAFKDRINELKEQEASAQMIGNGLVCSGQDVWMYVVPALRPADFLSAGAERQLVTDIVTLLANLEGRQIHTLIMVQDDDIEVWRRNLLEKAAKPVDVLAGPTATGGPAYNGHTHIDDMAKIQRQRRTRRVVHLLGIQLENVNRLARDDAAAEVGIMPDMPYSPQQLASWSRQADSLCAKLQASGLVQRLATSEELQQALAQIATQGLIQPDYKPGWIAGDQIKTLVNVAGPVHGPGRKSLVIGGEGEAVHVSYLTTTFMPPKTPEPAPDYKWIEHIQNLDFPVTLSLRWRLAPVSESARKVRRGIAASDEQLYTDADAGREFAEVLEGNEALHHLKYQIPRTKRGTVEFRARFMVSASTQAGLERRIERLQEDYKQFDIWLYPFADCQLRLHKEAMPGDRPRLDTMGRREVDLEMIALGAPFTSWGLGDGEGPYIGFRADTNVAVRVNFGALPSQNRAPVVLSVGKSGSGKSYLLKLIAYLTSLVYGAKGFYWDLKNESEFTWLPALGRVSQLDFDTDPEQAAAQAGLLNPFYLAINPRTQERDQTEGADIARAYLMMLLPKLDASLAFVSLQNRLSRICREVARGDNPALRDVVERVVELSKEANRQSGNESYAIALETASERFVEVMERPNAGLIFDTAPRAEAGHEVPRLTILRTKQMMLESIIKAEDDTDLSTLLMRAQLLLLVRMIYKLAFASGGREQIKYVCFDECRILFQIPEAQRLMINMAILGRYYNVISFFSAQEAGDLEALKGQASMISVFYQDDDDQITSALELLGVNPGYEHNRDRVKRLVPGVCLFADGRGHIGPIVVDATLKALGEAFDTNPMAHSTVQAG